MSDTDNNGSNGSSDNNNQSNETNNPVSTPAVETPKQEEIKPTENPAPTPEPVKDESSKVEDKPAEPTKDEGVGYTPPKAEEDNTSVTDNVVAFSISGGTNLSGKVPKGMNVKDAIAKLGGNASGYSFRDSNNKMIYGTHIINENIKLTASTRASGG